MLIVFKVCSHVNSLAPRTVSHRDALVIWLFPILMNTASSQYLSRLLQRFNEPEILGRPQLEKFWTSHQDVKCEDYS